MGRRARLVIPRPISGKQLALLETNSTPLTEYDAIGERPRAFCAGGADVTGLDICPADFCAESVFVLHINSNVC